MRDSVVFAQVRALQGRKRSARLSATALEIHVRAVADRTGAAYPAFVPDERLELCMAGMWYRASDGYVIADLDLIEHFARPVGRRWLHAVGRFFKDYLIPV